MAPWVFVPLSHWKQTEKGFSNCHSFTGCWPQTCLTDCFCLKIKGPKTPICAGAPLHVEASEQSDSTNWNQGVCGWNMTYILVTGIDTRQILPVSTNPRRDGDPKKSQIASANQKLSWHQTPNGAFSEASSAKYGRLAGIWNRVSCSWIWRSGRQTNLSYPNCSCWWFEICVVVHPFWDDDPWDIMGWLMTLFGDSGGSWKYHLEKNMRDVPAPKQIKGWRKPYLKVSLGMSHRITSCLHMFTTRSLNLASNRGRIQLWYYVRCSTAWVVHGHPVGHQVVTFLAGSGRFKSSSKSLCQQAPGQETGWLWMLSGCRQWFFDLTLRPKPEIIVNKGNHPKIALFQVN